MTSMISFPADQQGYDRFSSLIEDALSTEQPEGPIAFSVKDEAAANWVVRKIVERRQYRERVKGWAEQEISRSETDEDRLMYLFGAQLRCWAMCEIGRMRGRRKSIALPSGTVGFRHERARLVIDDEKAVMEWARKNCAAAIQITERLSKTVVTEHFDQTGELPSAGAHVEAERERFRVS